MNIWSQTITSQIRDNDSLIVITFEQEEFKRFRTKLTQGEECFELYNITKEELDITKLLVEVKDNIILNQEEIILEKDDSIEKLVKEGNALLKENGKLEKKLKTKKTFNSILIGTNAMSIICLVILLI